MKWHLGLERPRLGSMRHSFFMQGMFPLPLGPCSRSHVPSNAARYETVQVHLAEMPSQNLNVRMKMKFFGSQPAHIG